MALTTKYDAIFQQYGRPIPAAYLRALGYKESGLNAADTSGAIGLLSIENVVRESYNERHGTAYTTADLTDPRVNVLIVADHLKYIAGRFAKHPSRNMKTDWTNPEFVKILTAGWNSGHSEAPNGGGVGCAASYLERNGIPVTHDNLFQYAAAAGCTRHLQNTAKQLWQRAVVDLYLAQPDAPKGGDLVKMALAGFVVWGAYTLWKTYKPGRSASARS